MTKTLILDSLGLIMGYIFIPFFSKKMFGCRQVWETQLAQYNFILVVGKKEASSWQLCNFSSFQKC